MRLVSVAALVVTLFARSAIGASILYATAATPGRVDAFCLDESGGILPEPVFQTSVGDVPDNAQPRRLLVANGVLYVAEVDRVEAFRIGTTGGLRRIGGTKPDQGTRPLDLLVANGMLYVTEGGAGRVTAYPLDADGAPAENFTSCILSGGGLSYQRFVMDGSLLYVSASGLPGDVEVHAIGADGSLASTGDACKLLVNGKRPARTAPLSERGRLQNPKALALLNGVIYVAERESKVVAAFKLTNGLFTPPVRVTKTKKRYQKPLSVTAAGPIYEAMVTHGDSLLLSVFGKGRVDSFRVRPTGKVPKGPSATTEADVRMSPVGLLSPAGKNIVYVAAGALDRVVAYRLKKNGVVAEGQPFSETTEQTGSFPNDVAIAVLPGGCG